MKSLTVFIKEAEDVKAFVGTVSKFDYEVDLRSGRWCVNAKSILGIFSLDLSKPLTLEIHSDDCDELLEGIKKYTK